MKQVNILIVILIVNLQISYSQIDNSRTDRKLNEFGFLKNVENDFSGFLYTGTQTLTSPLHFQNEDFLLTGIIIGATALSFTLDNTVRAETRKIQSSGMDKFTNIGEQWGNPKYASVLSGLMYVGGHLFKDRELRKTGVMLVETIFLNGIITQGLKMAIGRSRPYQEEGNLDILGFQKLDTEHSLPSGHTSTAFAVSTILSERFNNIYLSVALYSVAGLTAFQRTYADRHWFSDTILGAAIGTLVGLKVLSLNSERDEEISDGYSLDIAPYYNETGAGIGMSLKF